MVTPRSEPVAHAPAVPEVVVAGHVSLDVFPTLYGHLNLHPGELMVVGPAVMSTGGAVANTGLALHRLGVRVGLIAKVGDDMFGTAVLDALARQGEHLISGIVVCPAEATSYSIVISPPGVDRSFLHCPGANQTFSASDVPYHRLAGVRVFHFGYPPLMPLMYADGGAQLRSMFERVLEAGPATALDLCAPDPDSDAGRVDWQEVLRETLPFVDVFTPSIDELLFVFDRPAHDRLQAGAALASIVDHPRLSELSGLLTEMGAAVVAIKLGDQGLYLRTSPDASRISAFCGRMGLGTETWLDRELFSPCFQARTVGGTTGSGDATIAGLLAALLRGRSPREAAITATAVGACSVESVDPTSGIPTWARLAERVADGWPRRDVELSFPPDIAVQRDGPGTMVLAPAARAEPSAEQRRPRRATKGTMDR